MTRAARAFVWELSRKHRLGLMGIALYVVVVVTIRLAFFDLGETIEMKEGEKFAIIVVVPITIVYTYLVAVFTYGLAGDIAARQSMFPPRLFTLPVSSGELALWPMAVGTLLVAVLWLVTRTFAVWPTGVVVPFAWPALAIASLLAWAQALTWLPYPLPGLRVAIGVVGLSLLQGMVLIALNREASEWVMLSLLAPQLPVAYLVARYAVGRARSGDTPDWTSLFRLGARSAASLTFKSAERAQAWFEWKRHGLALPSLVATLLPFELALLWVAGQTRLVYVILFGVAITPPFMAAFTAATIAKPNQGTGDAYGLSPFIATRPLSSAALIGAKLRMTVWSTALTWLLVLVVVPLALKLSGTWDMVATFARGRSVLWGMPRALTLLVVVIGALALTTWRTLVQTLYVGLAGRVWLYRAWLIATLLALSLAMPALEVLGSNPRLLAWLWDAKAWLVPGIALAKLAAAMWLATLLYRSALVRDRTLLVAAAAWSIAALALYGVFAWWIATSLFPVYIFGAVAILIVPLARVLAAPLALASNRHR